MVREQLNLRIRTDLADRLRVQAAGRGVRPNVVVEELLEAGLDEATPERGSSVGRPSAPVAKASSRRAQPIAEVDPILKEPPLAVPVKVPVGDLPVACPECAGDLVSAGDRMLRCEDCSWTMEVST